MLSKTSWFAFFLLLAAGCGDDDTPTPGDAGDAGDSDVPAEQLAFERIEFDVEAPTFIVAVPATTDEFVVADHGGTVFHLRVVDDSAQTLGSFVVPEVFQGGDCGLLSLAFDPGWEDNRIVYAGHCSPELGSRVTRMDWDGASYEGVAASAAIVLDVPAVVARNGTNHSVGSFLFEDDGTMLVTLGDKASEDGQNLENLAGTIVRIVPNREPGGEGYTVPAGNAFPGGAGGLEEIYVYGLRYPYRIAYDSGGRVWVADVGGGLVEEVNLVQTAGQNFGWRECEGPCETERPEFTPPLLFWERSDEGHPYFAQDPESEPTTRRAAWVAGTPSDGPDLYDGLLRDKVLFGDLCLGWVRAARVDSSGTVTEDMSLGHLPHVVSWTFASDGRGYVVTFGSCDATMPLQPPGLWRVVAR